MDKSSSIENKRVSAIKTVLEREGLKQKDLAEMIGIEPQNLSRCMVSGKISSLFFSMLKFRYGNPVLSRNCVM